MTKGKMVIVEDNPDDAELILRAFKQHRLGKEVVVLMDGEEVLQYFFGLTPPSGGMPQVIVLDLKLPKLNGLDVLKRLKADPRTRAIPIVVLTTSGEEADLVASYELGASSYMTKPVDFVEFAESIKQLGLYWLTLNQTPEQVPC